MTGARGKRRGGPARDPIPRAQNRNTLPRTRQSASAHRNSSESPQQPPPLLASSAGRCGGDPPSCRSHRQRPASLRGRGSGLRTITPFADALHAQLTFVAGRVRRGLRAHPGHPTVSRDAGASRMYAPPGDSQPPITCFRLYAPGARSPHHSAPPPTRVHRLFQLPSAPRGRAPASTARRRGKPHSGTVRSARTRAD